MQLRKQINAGNAIQSYIGQRGPLDDHFFFLKIDLFFTQNKSVSALRTTRIKFAFYLDVYNSD